MTNPAGPSAAASARGKVQTRWALLDRTGNGRRKAGRLAARAFRDPCGKPPNTPLSGTARGNRPRARARCRQARSNIPAIARPAGRQARDMRPVLSDSHILERVAGIEPARPAWKAGALPLHHTRSTSLVSISRGMARQGRPGDSMLSGVLLDNAGVLYQGDQAVPGVVGAVQRLRQNVPRCDS